ncbi:abortive phage resistance protein [Paucilactobacillus hokkaidonensis JCM 18461]|uniref:Abortive phage resistance protein n=2 Tax=Paucilactobacillus hokkaidonensis TaxID=1193095 RepID=A0A0A1GTD9_9LACO|nr:RloB family protein [Paucilactobacillus hokkaidonensis]KRO09533.1 abortive phage resistance protein [Paucilactobacillus hokkaidonensis]BAP85245.1 abortive phage resistance protein [Paucilactobacillus hokkaidonensis JCM 18461]
MSRRSKQLEFKPLIAIYCEGDSEKVYFEMLKRKYHASNVRAEKVSINSMGTKGLSLLYRAQSKIEALPKNKKIDQAYVIFDRDDLSNKELKKCNNYARSHKIKIMFSSVNIEIWVLMHFQPVSRVYTARELNRLLSGEKYFNTDYSKFKGNPYDEYLVDRVKYAKNNAEILLKRSTDPWYERDPYTNVNNFISDIFKVSQF